MWRSCTQTSGKAVGGLASCWHDACSKCVRMARALANIFPLGAVIGGVFEVHELLSEGPGGQVFGARDRALGRDVAIKAVWPGTRFDALRDEAHALAAFHHPGLVGVYGLGEHAGIRYVVLERVTGITLAAHFEQRAKFGGFTLAETLEMLTRLCDTLGVIHGAGLAHGGLRPETVLLAAGGRVVVFDLGVVHSDRVHDATAERYRAPEAASLDEPIRAQQLRDVYALGVLAFEMLTGALPRPREPIALQLARACTEVPEGLSGLVVEMLATPAGRPRLELIAASLRSLRAPERGDVPLSVVVADDDPDMRSLLGAVIRHVAPTARIRFACDGAEALRMVLLAPPDVLFLDLQMPELTGLEVCMYLRGTSLGDSVTICVMSQFGEGHRAVLKGLGVIDTFVKGKAPEALAAAVRTVFQRFAPSGPRARAPTLPSVIADPGLATVGGRYILERQLGEGGMGCVYEARHLHLGKKFALKVVQRSLAGDAGSRTRFLQEAKLASEISHPNIVSVVDFGEDPHVGAFMVMELLDGETLSNTGGRLSVRRACDVLGQVADALDLIHRRGIVHGDIKADNIMLVEEASGTRRRRVARLLDFGLAHHISVETIADSESIAGTPHYMAPERATGGRATVATDVYALGVLGYYLLTGFVPFDGSQLEILEAHVHTPPPALGPRRGEPIDPALEALILRALEKETAERHASVAAFRYELNTAMDMLDLGRRRPRSVSPDSGESRFAQMFTRSRIAQALFTVDGKVTLANKAFRAFAPEACADAPDLSALIEAVPELLPSLRKAHTAGSPVECRGVDRRERDASGLVLWATPVPQRTGELHVIVRFDEGVEETKGLV